MWVRRTVIWCYLIWENTDHKKKVKDFILCFKFKFLTNLLLRKIVGMYSAFFLFSIAFNKYQWHLVLVSGSDNLLLILWKCFCLAVWINLIIWFWKFLNTTRLSILLEDKTKISWKPFMIRMRIFIKQFVQRESQSSQIID